MKIIVMAGLIAALSDVSFASAGEGLINAQWCETQTSAPADTQAMVATMPDGKLRGTRSAATLIAEAKAAARAGRDDEAMGWARACQWHNQHAQQTIDAERGAVLQWLKG
jgi:hypothetical protein